MSPKKIMFCEDCTLMGVPVPENNDTCGNCGSHNVTVYEPVSGLTQRAPDVCPECFGEGSHPSSIGRVFCDACKGTGKRG